NAPESVVRVLRHALRLAYVSRLHALDQPAARTVALLDHNILPRSRPRAHRLPIPSQPIEVRLAPEHPRDAWRGRRLGAHALDARIPEVRLAPYHVAAGGQARARPPREAGGGA